MNPCWFSVPCFLRDVFVVTGSALDKHERGAHSPTQARQGKEQETKWLDSGRQSRAGRPGWDGLGVTFPDLSHSVLSSVM